ncbi:MAG: hypothetical protein P8L37_05055, partial [Phycisphaerales bacterium]|nr:hypothetical protein [Phycisphaerales bacterium]
WRCVPDHDHFKLAPGESKIVSVTIARDAGRMDTGYRAPEIRIGMDYLGPARRYSIPRKTIVIEVAPPEEAPAAAP